MIMNINLHKIKPMTTYMMKMITKINIKMIMTMNMSTIININMIMKITNNNRNINIAKIVNTKPSVHKL